LVNIDEKSKMVMARYFVAIGAEKIMMGEELMSVSDYLQKYIL
jgi:hypothetical protein